MKGKFIISLILSLSIVGGLLAGCGNNAAAGKKADTDSAQELEVIKVGASITPHAEILRSVSDELEKQGYKLEVVEYNDYIIPNTALESGELDANYIQHLPYLEDFNKENGTDIVSVADIHYEPFGIYAGKSDSLENLKEGAVIAVPNDTTNEARALLLLQDQGLIKLKENAGLTATVKDIADNPKNFEIKELEAAQVPKALQDVDVAAINTNYALEANLKLSDALASEGADSLAAKTYANIIAVKEGNENAEKIKALIDAVKSEQVKKFIEDKYDGAVVPIF
ncbi:MetQ/NlpA family ABC transporter substrate-binding protein [Lachnospiraceae bacterium 38-14]|uniref:MetQ/NlpA family ABC transporter substrate-binding protein n=1 Tax=Roseburia sp. 1XD42-69 TaxID=2320088 RepID=UPI000EA0C1BD|nr:MetQ/NlpA family ABC transporter substrate-binding protein [Roseburia sp. 1XD42-69]RKJ61819.1 ABC transporter substrate-binding protein [Roseburia sp. 1XD42-69]